MTVFQIVLVQEQDTAQQQALTDAVDALLDPVDGGGGGVLTGHIAHAHVADKGEGRKYHGGELFHPDGNDAQHGADTAQTQHHHSDEDEAAAEHRGRRQQQARNIASSPQRICRRLICRGVHIKSYPYQLTHTRASNSQLFHRYKKRLNSIGNSDAFDD